MTALYRTFFLLYGGVHLLGGAMIATIPSVMKPVLNEPLSPAVATLLGFMSCLAGVGFLGAAWVNETAVRRIIIRLAIVGNVLNAGAHMANAARGDSPFYLAVAAGVGVAVLVVLLIVMDRRLIVESSAEKTPS